MSKLAHNYIQIFIAIALMGYWLTNSVATYLFGDTPLSVSVIYWGVLLLMSIIAMSISRQHLGMRDNNFLRGYIVIMFAYAIRMFVDIVCGPYVGEVPNSIFLSDMLVTICGVFLTTYAIMTCRYDLDLDKVCQWIYWIGLVIILIIPRITDIDVANMQDAEDRMEAGRGLGSLAIVKIGVIEVIVSLHLLFNQRRKYLYVLGLVLAIWTTLAAGSRGGLISLIIALFYYMIINSRKNIFRLLVVAVFLYVVVVNIIPILEWLSQYFPVIGYRMIGTIMDNDQSGRELLRERAYELISNHPILGYSYRLSPSKTGYSCHNGVLDIFLAFGIPFGLLALYMVYFRSVVMSTRLVMYKKYFMPVVMAIWVLIASMSGSGITDATFCFSICLLGIVYHREKSNLKK